MTKTDVSLISLLGLFYPAAFVICTARGNVLVLRG